MVDMSCTSEDKYKPEGHEGCCDRCPAGKFKQKDCDSTGQTVCVDCDKGTFLATKNHITKCNLCKSCSQANKQTPLTHCTATQNTVCQCLPGHYCNNDDCDHCQPVTRCLPGTGVKFQATRTNDTVCAPCEEGTYNNVTDSHSPCTAHTRCEDYGGVLKTQGTATTDTVCGQSLCSWILPAGLWAGFVLTVLLVIIFLIWRAKHRSCRTVKINSGVSVERVPSLPVTPPELPSHCQETCTIDVCKLPLFNEDDTPITCCIQDSLDSSLPLTTINKLKTSVSFVECDNRNGHPQPCPTNFLRSYSEPQEDEWCGT
ncbi:tumor necrosis factor receptor superfamily member 5 [Parambassis ranga]|uniref:Tumor necrosis factor receptor superfamily member 5 n=1 Tax=Parambassis ranga TaxID=210632 RepID=A0A6P7JTQ9_9TELE|nr:tumor necrosis factor receptor superfamily member 5-like [Parambassis ranga]